MHIKLMVYVYLTSHLVKLESPKTYDCLIFMHLLIVAIVVVVLVVVSEAVVADADIVADVVVCIRAKT